MSIEFDHGKAAAPQNDHARKLQADAAAKAQAEKRQGGIKDLAEGRQDIFRVNPYTLTVRPGWNNRMQDDPANEEHIRWLAANIAKHGVLEPLAVFWENGAPVVENGHCRLLATFIAINKLGATIDSIPVQVTDRRRTEKQRVMSQIVRNSGKNLSPLEQARVYQHAIETGATVEELAEEASKTPAYIRSLLDLLKAPMEIIAPVDEGKVSATLALKVLKDEGGDGKAAAARLGAAIAQAEKSGAGKATERHVRATSGATGGKRPVASPAKPTLVSEQTNKTTEPKQTTEPKPTAAKRSALSAMSDTERLKGLLAVLNDATWNDTPKRGQPITIELSGDQYERLRDMMGD